MSIVYSPHVKLQRTLGGAGRTVSIGHYSVSPPTRTAEQGNMCGQSRTDHLRHCMSAKWSSVAARPSLGSRELPSVLKLQGWVQSPSKSSILVLRSYHIRALPWRPAAHCNLGFVPFWIWKKMTASSLVLPSKFLLSHLHTSLLSSEFRFFTKGRKHSCLPAGGFWPRESPGIRN